MKTQKYQEIRKHDIITGKANNPKSKVYIVLDIVSATSNGSIDLIVMPICKRKHIESCISYSYFPVKSKLIGKIKCIDVLIDDIEILGYINPESIPFLMDIKEYKRSVKNTLNTYGWLIPMSAKDEPICYIEYRDREEGDTMEKYEIDEMIMCPTTAIDFLRSYQEFSNTDVMQIYGMNSDELEYAITLLKKRYDYKNPNPRR